MIESGDKDRREDSKEGEWDAPDFLRKLESPEINEIYLNYICERDLTFYRKLLGDMKQETLDFLASGVLEKASEKLKRMIEKGRRKNEKKNADVEEQEENDKNSAKREPEENDDGNKNSAI